FDFIYGKCENVFSSTILNDAFFSQLLDSVWGDVPKEHKDRTSKKYLRVALDKLAASVNLPPYGAVDQVDVVVNEAFKMANADDGKEVDEAEFKKLLTEILGAVMLQLDGNAIAVSTNTVLHEPMSTSSTLLSPSPSPPTVSPPSE
uniref:EF-hand domain-containing protein n=1 Tax=Aegilops tauschii subsp. strangulata TaxID=200361 RepID=A0A453CQP4_AEGTS